MADAIPMPTHRDFKDLSGLTFDRWSVLSYAGKRGVHHYWDCRCVCSVTRSVNAGSLSKGASASCGCLKREQLSERRFIDIIGQTFGRLVAVARADTANKRTMWFCVCSCGGETVVDGASLKTGRTSSCGCLYAETLAAGRRFTHRLSGTPEYDCWGGIVQRCENPNNPAYDYYGGRGIVICARWREDYANFFADMGPRPSSLHSIDRIDNDGNYEPGNCRWATKSEQAFNRRPKGSVRTT